MRDDRREFQRLKLSKPILATMRGSNALILDVGLAGAFLEHYGTAEPGERFPLLFRWQGHDVEFSCEVARTVIVRDPGGDGKSLVSHTGVRFLEPRDDAMHHLQDLITSFVGRILTAQKANASGELGESAGATILARLGEARRMRSRFAETGQDGGARRANQPSSRSTASRSAPMRTTKTSSRSAARTKRRTKKGAT
jgi:hypothetical protein